MANSSERDQGFKQVSDMARMVSIGVLILHFYHFCYPAFSHWHLTAKLSDRIMLNLERTGLFTDLIRSKLIALGFLGISIMSQNTTRSQKAKVKNAVMIVSIGFILYFLAQKIFWINEQPILFYKSYMALVGLGYLLLLSGGSLLFNIFRGRFSKEDVFNSYNETFPQEERLLENEFSISLRAFYKFKGEVRRSWINIVNPRRGTLICGSSGSGKTVVVEQIIEQHIRKGFAMVVYDFKYPDLSKLTYNYYLKYRRQYEVPPEFHYLNFDDPNFSHRCNFLQIDNLEDITDAAEFSRAFLLGLNKEWIEKQGDFWVESPINLLTAIIWFLRKYQNGKYCSFAHAIELLQADYGKLFTVLRMEPEIEAYINPFMTAYLTESTKQLQGQVDGLKIAIARISSAKLYYILTGDDFKLNIANPKAPQILCIGNTPHRSQVYGSVISVYLAAIQRLLNRPNNHKSHIILEEFPTIYLNSIDKVLALSRSYNVATTLVIQNYHQLALYYGKTQAEVIFNLPGNIICGQNFGETARLVSERIGKILQNKESTSESRADISVHHSVQLDFAVPLSTIAKLSPGEMVGVVVDSPEQKTEFKAFHSQLMVDVKQITQKRKRYKNLPQVRKLADPEIFDNYLKIKQEAKTILSDELSRIMNTPELAGMIVI